MANSSDSLQHIIKCPICFITQKAPNIHGEEYANIWHPFKNKSRDIFIYDVCSTLHKRLDVLIEHIIDNYFKYVIKIKYDEKIKVVYED